MGLKFFDRKNKSKKNKTKKSDDIVRGIEQGDDISILTNYGINYKHVEFMAIKDKAPFIRLSNNESKWILGPINEITIHGDGNDGS